MKIKSLLIMGFFVIALAGTFVFTGCCDKTVTIPAPGPAEKAGAALDKAVEKTSTEVKDAADKAIDKTGEILEKAGDSLEKTGADLKDN